ncbi:MAG: C40 family peptidase [Bacteriovoracaceae bacterium]
MLSYAMSMLGVPYLWAGNSRLRGVDCSGFVCECLRSIGIIGHEDYSAQMLYSFIKTKPFRSKLKRGSVLFFGATRNKISHVGIALNSELMIESGGGDNTTRKFFDAVNSNAMVRIRPIRSDLVACIYPVNDDVNGNT